MSRHELRAADYLQHILEAITRAVGYVSGSDTLAAFEMDGMAQDAVVRTLEITMISGLVFFAFLVGCALILGAHALTETWFPAVMGTASHINNTRFALPNF